MQRRERVHVGTVIEPYEVLGELRGRTSVSYEARETEIQRTVTLEVVALPDESARYRLHREVEDQAELGHRYVVPFDEAVETDDAVALISERVVGPDLDAALKLVTLTESQIDVLGRQLMEGVAAAHALGHVHGALSADQVVLEVTTTDVVPRIGGFGLAQVLGRERGENLPPLGRTDDIRSLGVLLERLMDASPSRETLPERMYRAVGRALRAEPGGEPVSGLELIELWQDGQASPTLPWAARDRAKLRSMCEEPVVEVPDALPPIDPTPEPPKREKVVIRPPPPEPVSESGDAPFSLKVSWVGAGVLMVAMVPLMVGLLVFTNGLGLMGRSSRTISVDEGLSPRPVSAKPPTIPGARTLIRVEGSDNAFLIDDNGAMVAPGDVRPGGYWLYVSFSDQEPVRLRHIEVRSGETIRVVCDSAAETCR